MPTAAYLGTPAHLAPLEYVRSIEVKQDSRYSFQSAASRTWAFVSSGPGGIPARSWSVSLIVDSRSAATLQGFAEGSYGAGPFAWLPESAYIANALTPAQASLAGMSGPGVEAVDGWSPRSALGPANADLAVAVPVLGNHPVTGTVDVSGPATLRLTFRNASGTIVGTNEKMSTGSAMQRLSVSVAKAPLTARTVDMRVGGHTYVTRPQLTWLAKATPWAAGAGASSVVIEELSFTPLHLDGSGDVFQTATLKIQEVR